MREFQFKLGPPPFCSASCNGRSSSARASRRASDTETVFESDTVLVSDPMAARASTAANSTAANRTSHRADLIDSMAGPPPRSGTPQTVFDPGTDRIPSQHRVRARPASQAAEGCRGLARSSGLCNPHNLGRRLDPNSLHPVPASGARSARARAAARPVACAPHFGTALCAAFVRRCVLRLCGVVCCFCAALCAAFVRYCVLLLCGVVCCFCAELCAAFVRRCVLLLCGVVCCFCAVLCAAFVRCCVLLLCGVVCPGVRGSRHSWRLDPNSLRFCSFSSSQRDSMVTRRQSR